MKTIFYEKDQDPLIIGEKKFLSRLMLGTGKYKNFKEAKESILASECEILTVAVRRAQSSSVEGINDLLSSLDWAKIWLMPNTAGCQTAQEAIRVAFLGREITKNIGFENNNFTKLNGNELWHFTLFERWLQLNIEE